MQWEILVDDVTLLQLQPCRERAGAVQNVCHVWLPQGSALHADRLPLRVGILLSCFSRLGRQGNRSGDRMMRWVILDVKAEGIK